MNDAKDRPKGRQTVAVAKGKEVHDGVVEKGVVRKEDREIGISQVGVTRGEDTQEMRDGRRGPREDKDIGRTKGTRET